MAKNIFYGFILIWAFIVSMMLLPGDLPPYVGGMIGGWLCTISGGIMVGIFVFKSKREAHETFFPPNNDGGEAYNLNDEFGDDYESPTLPTETVDANNAFVNHMGKTMTRQADSVLTPDNVEFDSANEEE